MTPHKQSPTFHPKCRIDKGLTKKGEAQVIKGRSGGPEWSTPYACIRSFVYSFIHAWHLPAVYAASYVFVYLLTLSSQTI
jgi:hypothetical protein